MSIFLQKSNKNQIFLQEAPGDPIGVDNSGEENIPTENTSDKAEEDVEETPQTENKDTETEGNFGDDFDSEDNNEDIGMENSTDNSTDMSGGMGTEEKINEPERKLALIEKFEELLSLIEELLLSIDKIILLELSKRESKQVKFITETLNGYKTNIISLLERKINNMDYAAVLSFFITIRTGSVLIGKLLEEISEETTSN
jgi:hypothetical protein